MKTITNGIVVRDTTSEQHAAPVERIEFPDVGKHDSVKPGAQGVMYLKTTPAQIGHFERNDRLTYRDTNRHNDAGFRVVSNDGPMKYRILKMN